MVSNVLVLAAVVVATVCLTSLFGWQVAGLVDAGVLAAAGYAAHVAPATQTGRGRGEQ